MGKKIFLTTALSMCLASAIFAADESGNENLIIDKNSEVAQKLIKNETDYKAYLHKKGDLVRFDKARADQLQANSCDINKLKTAVVMLIERIEKLESEGVSIKESNVIPPISDDTVNSMTDVSSKKEAIDNIVAPDADNITVCKKVKVQASWTDEDIKHSYIRYIGQKNFMASVDADAFLFPTVDSALDTEHSLKKGQRFKADMWTKGGWIHAVGGGWVKGYLMSPPFYQIKTPNQKAGVKQYQWKEECTTVPLKK